MIDPNVLKRYVELKAEEKRIAAEIDELKPIIIEHMTDEKIDKLPTSLGSFSLSSRGTWKYTAAVTQLQEEEKAKGIAKQVFSNSLIFKSAEQDLLSN
jgi:hypothetical protein